MSLQRLCGRLTRLEAQRRPWVVADILRRTRLCVPSEVGTFLLEVLTSVDKAAATAIMEQLTDAEWEALIPPEILAYVETLTESELEALVNGGPVARQRAWRAFQRWLEDRP